MNISANTGSIAQASAGPAGFDYRDLDRSVAAEVKQTAVRILKRTHDVYIENGRDLIAAQELLGHGNFGAWLAAEFGWTDRTARNLMNAARFADSNPEIISVLPVTAIYKLAAPSTPKEARDEIVARALRGEKQTVRETEETIKTAKAAMAEERRVAKEQQRIARMSPRQRRTRQKRQEEHEREMRRFQELEQAQQAAAILAVQMLTARLGSELSGFLEIAGQTTWSHIGRQLIESQRNKPLAVMA